MTLATRALREPFPTDFRSMDNLFNRFFWPWTGSPAARVTAFVPILDVRETETEYVVWADLPGVKKEDVSIELQDNVLSISGVRAPVEEGEAQLVERPYGSFTRTLTVPSGIDPDAIVASYHDGVLELHLPKPANLKPKKIEIGSGQKALGR